MHWRTLDLVVLLFVAIWVPLQAKRVVGGSTQGAKGFVICMAMFLGVRELVDRTVPAGVIRPLIGLAAALLACHYILPRMRASTSVEPDH